MKGSFNIQGNPQHVPHEVSTTFKLRDYSTAHLSLNIMGDYNLTVPGNPYMVNTARRSPYYKPATDNLTRQMIDRMDAVVSAYVDLLEKCEMPQSFTLFKNRLDNLRQQQYARKVFHINQPTLESVKKELEEEAKHKFYSLFRTNTAQIQGYVNENLQDVYSAKLKQWDDLKEYFELVENTVEKRENEEYKKEYDKEKTALENFVYGPEALVIADIREKCSSISLPTDVAVKYEYTQKEGLIDAIVEAPDRLQIGLPTQKFGLYASGKLQVKNRATAELAPMYTDYYLGVAFVVASSLFQVSVNVKTVRVSLINNRSRMYLLWLEFDRDRFSSIDFKRAGVFNEAMSLPNVIVMKGYDIVELVKDSFFKKVEEAIDSNRPKPLPQRSPKDKTISVSISDATLLLSYYPAAQTLKSVIDEAKKNGVSTIEIDHRFEGTLDELREAKAKGKLPQLIVPESEANGKSIDPESRTDSKQDRDLPQQERVPSPEIEPKSEGALNHFSVVSVKYQEAAIVDQMGLPDDVVDGGLEDTLKGFLSSIIASEAPISKTLLFRKALLHLGIARVGSRLASYMEGLAMRMQLKENGTDRVFVWSQTQAPENYNEFRTDSGRDATDIAPEEVANAMISILNQRQVILEEDLCRETARVFSFTRMGTNVTASMNDGLNKLYERKLAVKDGNVVRLRETTSSIVKDDQLILPL